MGGNESIRFNLRMPQWLKEKCEKIANQNNLTLSEWIKRTLTTVVGGDLEDNDGSVMEDIDWFVSSPNLFGVRNRADFLKEAIYLMSEAVSCSYCGAINLGDGEFCTNCGEELNWKHPDEKYAQSYLDKYRKEHPLPTGWHYSLLVPSKHLDMGFAIMKYQDWEDPRPIQVKKITKKDIEEMKGDFQRQLDGKNILDEIDAKDSQS